MEHNVKRNRRSVSSKTLALLLALVLALGVAAGGTIAWLVAKSETVTNTFTYGNINIELTETTGNTYKIIPGVDIKKDPKVTVKADSEACYLFVKVEETGTFVDGKVSYAIDTTVWTKLPDVDGVYYREVDASTSAQEFYVLAGNKITVSEDLTKAEVNGIKNQPTLTFTAYAVQKDGIADAATAWAKVTP